MPLSQLAQIAVVVQTPTGKIRPRASPGSYEHCGPLRRTVALPEFESPPRVMRLRVVKIVLG